MLLFSLSLEPTLPANRYRTRHFHPFSILSRLHFPCPAIQSISIDVPRPSVDTPNPCGIRHALHTFNWVNEGTPRSQNDRKHAHMTQKETIFHAITGLAPNEHSQLNIDIDTLTGSVWEGRESSCGEIRVGWVAFIEMVSQILTFGVSCSQSYQHLWRCLNSLP